MDFLPFCSCDLDIDLNPTTFIYTLDPYSMESRDIVDVQK